MDLEDLRRHWGRLDEKLDRSLALETELVRELVLRPARRRVHLLAFWPGLDVAACVGTLALVGAYLGGGHGHDWRLVPPAVGVMAGAVALLAASVWQLERVSRLDWGGPVAEIQGSLERLRAARVRQFQWTMLLAPLVGFCGLLVGLDWSLGRLAGGRAQTLDKLDSRWVAANYAFGVLWVPAGYYAARALAARCRGRRWWRAVLDGIAGNSLRAAARDVERWASLGRGD